MGWFWFLYFPWNWHRIFRWQTSSIFLPKIVLLLETNGVVLLLIVSLLEIIWFLFQNYLDYFYCNFHISVICFEYKFIVYWWTLLQTKTGGTVSFPPVAIYTYFKTCGSPTITLRYTLRYPRLRTLIQNTSWPIHPHWSVPLRSWCIDWAVFSAFRHAEQTYSYSVPFLLIFLLSR